MSTPLIWTPTSCTLQLTFGRPGGSATAGIQSGCTYQGTSCIRYRREALDAPTDTTTSEYADFLRHRQVVAQKHALHLHALTTPGGIYKDARPLQVSSYQVATVSSSSSTGGGGKNGALKVLSVEQEDAAAAATTAAASASDKKQKTSKAKPGNAKKNAPAGHTHEAGGEAPEAGAVDWGSKLVFFDSGDALPCNSEVELTVLFTGTVQSFDHGGIYAARADITGSSTDAALLTHLEVRFARCAFPCPDDPQYRLDWQLRSLQLPDTYTTVLTNGEEVGRKAMPAQHAVQLSYSPCGPLPAYVFAFACFPEPMEEVGAVMEIPEFTGDIAHGMQGSTAALSCSAIPLRVMARRQARIPTATLDRVLRITQEAVAALQQLFDCPLPLLRCRHLEVILGPTMPFISGMEHHCSILLNETIYQPPKKGGASSANAEAEQTELVLHELAHHWVGNALGLPFPVKEGICQVLEVCIGDTLLGKPMRKFKPDSTSTGAAGSSTEAAAGAATTTTSTTTTTIQASERGHEFTGTSYQLALSAIRRMVAESGFEAFASCLRRLVRETVVDPMLQVEEQGGAQMLRLMGESVPPPPYLSTEAFLHFMESSL